MHTRKHLMAVVYLLSFLLILTSCEVSKALDTGLIALVQSEGKYGYLKPDGTWHIEPNYTLAFPFSEGLACVTKDSQANQRRGETLFDFIDQNGETKFQMKLAKPTAFAEGRAVIKQGKWYGFINKKGKVVLSGLHKARGFKEGLALVQDSTGRMGYITSKGKWQIELEANASFDNFGDFHEGLAWFACPSEKIGANGYLNQKGEIIIPCTFTGGQHFREGLAGCYTNEARLASTYIDTEGNRALESEYDQVFPFHEGLACVKRDRKYGFINQKGELVIPFDSWMPSYFSEGLVSLRKQISPGVETGYMDTTGKWVIEQQFTAAYPFENGYAVFVEKQKYGVIDKTGKKVIPAKFDRFYRFSEPQATQRQGNRIRWGR